MWQQRKSEIDRLNPQAPKQIWTELRRDELGQLMGDLMIEVDG